MAEICCGVVGEGDTPTPMEPSSRPSARRSLDMLPLKFMANMPIPPPEASRKRQKLDLCVSPPPEREVENAVETCQDRVGGPQEEESEGSVIPVRLEDEVVVVDESPKYGVTSVCGRRRDMEDAVSVRPSFSEEKGVHFFGVYDGHGCSHVATMCKERMHEIVKEEIAEKPESKLDWKSTMEQSFTRMDEEVLTWTHSNNQKSTCRCELQTPHCDAVGSTAVVAVVTPEKIIVSNCGDSRAVLCRNGVAIPLSSDHKPDRPDELNRIESAGGRVIYWDGPRVLGVLAMSRAIGE